MQYYKNSELARLYHVSQSAVGKWVEAARKGRLDLELIEHGTKSYIAATTKNRTVIDAMVQERKKYFNSRSIKSVTPKPEFYTLFNPEQVLDIIKNLENHGEIPRQYNYFGEGAARWDEHIKKRVESKNLKNMALMEARQLAMNRTYLDTALAPYKKVNIVDVGPGNAWPVKGQIEHFIANSKLGRYVAIDISPEMIELACRNVKGWFGEERIAIEADIRDITRDRFDDILANLMRNDPSRETANLVLVLGGTIGNFTYPDEALRILYHSIGRNDLLVYSLKLDAEDNRQIFDFTLDGHTPSSIHSFVLEMLNIDPSFYDIEIGFDERRKQRYARLRLVSALSIEFDLPEGPRSVEFKKGESILIWHYRHQTAKEVIDQFENSGFNVIQASLTKDHEFLMLVCDIKTDR